MPTMHQTLTTSGTTGLAPEEDAWDVKRAAAFLGIASKTLYRLSAVGSVPHFKIGGSLRFDPKRLATWREAQSHGGAAR